MESKLINLNKPTQLFFFRLIGIVAAWKFIYFMVLRPARFPDKLLTDIITYWFAKGANFLHLTSTKLTWVDSFPASAAFLLNNGKTVFTIYDGCNGLELMLMYTLIITLMPYSATRKFVFSLIGTLVLIFTNVIRCICLYWIFLYRNELFEFNHHYVFTLVMYLVIFMGWVLFTKVNLHEKG